MHSNDIIKTSSKVFGLYFIIQTVMNLRDFLYLFVGTFSNDFGTEGNYMILASHIYMAVFNLVIGLILIFKAGWIAEKIQVQKAEKLSLNLEKTDWIELSLIIVSVLAILYSIPEIMYKMVNYIYFNRSDKIEDLYFRSKDNKAEILYSIFKFVAGLILLLNARNIARRLKKIGDKEDLMSR